MKEIPYYKLDENGNSEFIASNAQAYIDDEDLRELLIELLGDKVSESEIQEILEAASNKDMSEEEFDQLIDDFILNSKK